MDTFLEPCAFCGGKAEIFHISYYLGPGAEIARCTRCGNRTRDYSQISDVENPLSKSREECKREAQEKAVTAWNRRVEPDELIQLRAERDALAKELRRIMPDRKVADEAQAERQELK